MLGGFAFLERLTLTLQTSAQLLQHFATLGKKLGSFRRVGV